MCMMPGHWDEHSSGHGTCRGTAHARPRVLIDHFRSQGLLIFDPEEGDRAHGRDSQTGELAVPRWNLALVRGCQICLREYIDNLI